MTPLPAHSHGITLLIICRGLLCHQFQPCARATDRRRLSNWQKKPQKRLQYTANLPCFQGAFPAARRSTMAQYMGARLDLEKVHDDTAYE
jgi:hypothetical protein